MDKTDREWEQTYNKQLYRELLTEMIRDGQSIDTPFSQKLIDKGKLTEHDVEEVLRHAKKPSCF